MLAATNIAHLNSCKWLHFNLCFYLGNILISCFKRLSNEIWGINIFLVIEKLVAFYSFSPVIRSYFRKSFLQLYKKFIDKIRINNSTLVVPLLLIIYVSRCYKDAIKIF